MIQKFKDSLLKTENNLTVSYSLFFV